MFMARWRNESGLTSTEVAVLMPVVIVLILAPFQVALWWHGQQIVEAAAREAVDAAQVEGADEAAGIAAAHRFLDAAGNVTNPAITVTRGTEVVTVVVSGEAPRLIPGFGWQVTATAQGSLERFIREPDR